MLIQFLCVVRVGGKGTASGQCVLKPNLSIDNGVRNADVLVDGKSFRQQ